MVFIISQEYKHMGDKPTQNIISLEGHTDYLIQANTDTNLIDVFIWMGEMGKYLFSARDVDEATKVLQNIFDYHAKNDAWKIVDVNAFVIPDVNEEVETVETLHEDLLQIARFHGYGKIVDVYEDKLNEEYERQQRDGIDENTTLIIKEVSEKIDDSENVNENVKISKLQNSYTLNHPEVC